MAGILGEPRERRGVSRHPPRILAGLLGNVGMRDAAEGSYTGARGIKFWVAPGSWTRKPGTWIVAAELVDTTRLFARSVASIDPKWLEELGAHLAQARPAGSALGEKPRPVVALERGALYGYPYTPTTG